MSDERDPAYLPRHQLRDPNPPPTTDEVLAAQAESREALEQSEIDATEQQREHVTDVARQVARTESRRYGIWGALLAALLGLAVALLAVSMARSALAAAESSDQRSTATQRAVTDALGKLGEANRALEARGQAPVAVAPDPDASEAIQAAVLAQVLLKLPKAPTAEQVASELQPAVVEAVTNRTTLAGLIAQYFAANAPPGPTQEAIQAAVDRAYAANPPKDGRDGRDGLNGRDGASPPCLSEPTACRGADGERGPDGPVGPAGPPPASWTWTEPAPPLGDPVTHTCTRSGGTDSEPTYSCT